MIPESRDGVHRFRNHLPQWRMDSGVYFVTWRLQDPCDDLNDVEKTVVADAIKYFKDVRYRLSIYVVMDDHVHVVLQTLPGFDLGRVLLSLKTYTATQINKLRSTTGTRWQKDNYTELMRNDADVMTRREYVYRNPERKWNIQPNEYRWLEWFE